MREYVNPSRARVAALVAALAVAGGACRADSYAAVARAVPPHVDRTARSFLVALRNVNLAGAESLVVAAQRGPEVRSALGGLAATLGPAAPDSLRPVNIEGFFGSAANRVRVTYELAYRDRWVIARVDVLDSAGVAQVFGAQANVVPRAVAAANALTLRGKSPMHYVIAVIAAALPVFMVVTAIQVVRRRPPRRWLWAAVALVGVGKLSLNWTTGSIGFLPLQVRLLGVGIFQAGGPYAPWVLSVALPLGAIIAQIRMRRPPHEPEAGQAVPDAGHRAAN